MKNLVFVVLLLLGPLALAQKTPDKIQKKDKSVIDAIVLEISKNEIQYKKFSSPNGATFTVPTSDVASIVYASGYIDVMDADNPVVAAPVVKNTTVEPQNTTIQPAEKPSEPAENTSVKSEPASEEKVAKAEKKAKKSKKEKPAKNSG